MISLDRQNAFREQYRQQNPAWQPATEIFASLVRSEQQSSMRLLDVGCGRGGLAEQLDRSQCTIVGLDPDWQSLSEHRLPLPLVVATSDHLPLAATSCDVIYASWVLEHLARPALTFAAVARVLRPGGAFIFITPNGRHPLSWLNRSLGRFERLQGRLVNRLYGRAADDAFPTFYRANAADELTDVCTGAGLQLETLQMIPDPTYLAFNQMLFHLMVQIEDGIPDSRKLHLVGLARKPSR